MKNLIRLICTLFLLACIVSACNNKSEKKEATDTIEKSIDLSTQLNYEKFLTDMGVKLPDNSTFKELKKTNDGNYKIFYKLTPSENIQDSLQNFYEKQFDEILLAKGWTKPESGWNPHGTMYEKDKLYFKFFLVVSEEHQIYELAFKYGQ